eukprot:817201-Rhodomonas_salina.1
MPGTNSPYAATLGCLYAGVDVPIWGRFDVFTACVCCYVCRVVCGTELAYGATLLLDKIWYGYSIWCYALAIHCAVLSSCMALRSSYAMSGTEIACAAHLAPNPEAVANLLNIDNQ